MVQPDVVYETSGSRTIELSLDPKTVSQARSCHAAVVEPDQLRLERFCVFRLAWRIESLP